MINKVDVSKTFDYGDALNSLYPNCRWVLRGTDSLAGLEWNDPETPRPRKDELDAEIVRLQREYNNKRYQRQRQEEYPSVQAQLDMLYWDRVNGTDTWFETIQNIKNKYAKPE